MRFRTTCDSIISEIVKYLRNFVVGKANWAAIDKRRESHFVYVLITAQQLFAAGNTITRPFYGSVRMLFKQRLRPLPAPERWTSFTKPP